MDFLFDLLFRVIEVRVQYFTVRWLTVLLLDLASCNLVGSCIKFPTISMPNFGRFRLQIWSPEALVVIIGCTYNVDNIVILTWEQMSVSPQLYCHSTLSPHMSISSLALCQFSCGHVSQIGGMNRVVLLHMWKFLNIKMIAPLLIFCCLYQMRCQNIP